MAVNKLSYLVGDYQSDSDDDDHKRENAKEITTDWTQCKDANTGHPYYWNIVTKEVTWEIPNEYKKFLDQALIRYPNHLIKWSLCSTDDNKPYYFNDITREISWDKPESYIDSSPSIPTVKEENSDNNLKTKNKLNLVPEYNSDDSDDDSLRQDSGKVLFPSSNQMIESENSAKDQENESNSPKSEFLSKAKTFASIITGGRSPQHDAVINQFDIDENGDNTPIPIELNSNETEILPQKTFQRKRRIEFNVSHSNAKRINQTENTSNEVEKGERNSVTSTRNIMNKYGNFQKGETEFIDKSTLDNNITYESTVNDNVSIKQCDDVGKEQSLLESKLNFLCQGREDVSPVQVIQIQLQALQAARIADALHSDYFLEWMKSISNDIIKLENDVAPDGWKCIWNREKAQYCYENESTGEIKWEYPEEETIEQPSQDDNTDDAMDISTTPPHNPDEIYQNDSCTALPPPKWKADAINSTKSIEKPLDDELASFYSDIANLEPDATNEENSNDKTTTSTDTIPVESTADGDADDTKKKKKKKTKKLEPWRSGNLETWINKWQKAQKELDG